MAGSESLVAPSECAPSPPVLSERAPSALSPKSPWRQRNQDLSLDDLPSLRRLPQSLQQSRLEELRACGIVLDNEAVLPISRVSRDTAYALVFCFVGVVLVYLAIVYGAVAATVMPDFAKLLGLAVASSLFSGALVAIWLWLTRWYSLQIVQLTLYAGPLYLAILGIAVMAGSFFDKGHILHDVEIGAACFCVGFIAVTFICYRCRREMPFLARILELVAEVLSVHRRALSTGCLLSLLGVLWAAACCSVAAGLLLVPKLGDSWQCQAQLQAIPAPYSLLCPNATITVAMLSITALLFLWGTATSYYFVFTFYSGVFARWYYGRQDEVTLPEFSTPVVGRPLWRASKAALLALGCCSFASLVVPITRPIGMLLAIGTKSWRRQESEDGCKLCMVNCCIGCLACVVYDVMEYLNEWALVQVAVRGTNLQTSACLAFSVLTVGHAQYLVGDLLVNALVNFGALFTGLWAMTLAVLMARLSGTNMFLPASAALAIGLSFGLSVLSVLSSGVRTILMGFAEEPERLEQREQRLRPHRKGLPMELQAKIREGIECEFEGGWEAVQTRRLERLRHFQSAPAPTLDSLRCMQAGAAGKPLVPGQAGVAVLHVA